MASIPSASSTLQLLAGSRIHGGSPAGPASAAAAAAGVGVRYLNLSGGGDASVRASLESLDDVGTSIDDLLRRLRIPANPFGAGSYRGGTAGADSVDALLGDLGECVIGLPGSARRLPALTVWLLWV